MEEQKERSIGAALDTFVGTLERAIEVFGTEAQVGMAHEEMGELAAALNQWRRARVPFSVVEEEVADVLIVAMQVALMGGSGSVDRVEAALRRKVARLESQMPSADPPAPDFSGPSKLHSSTFDFWR